MIIFSRFFFHFADTDFQTTFSHTGDLGTVLSTVGGGAGADPKMKVKKWYRYHFRPFSESGRRRLFEKEEMENVHTRV